MEHLRERRMEKSKGESSNSFEVFSFQKRSHIGCKHQQIHNNCTDTQSITYPLMKMKLKPIDPGGIESL